MGWTRFCMLRLDRHVDSMWDASPEGRVGKRVGGQVAGVIVGSSSGRVQAKRGQGGHA